MKKVGLFLGIFFALLIAAIIVIPLVVDVDQYRPKIVEAVNQKMNGKFSLGQLKLSLWGRIQIDAAGLEIQDQQGRKVVSVQKAFFHLPYTSVLSGAPLLTLGMDSPEVRVVKTKDGKMNVMTLMKDDLTQQDNPDPQAVAKPGEGDAQGTKVPSVVSNARIGIDMRNALFHYVDEGTQSETVTKNLNLKVKDLSLARKTEIELSGLFESSQKDAFKIAGPFKVDASVDPKVTQGKLSGLGMDLDADFSDIEIRAGDAFHKKKGVKAKIRGKIDSIEDGMKIDRIVASFFNAEVTTTGLVKAISTETPEVDLSVTSNDIDLGPWNELIPMLKEYNLSGKAKLNAFAKGPAAQLQYGADFNVDQLKAKAPMLKVQPVMNVSVKVVTDKVEKLLATLNAPGTDITLEGSVVSFTSPKVDMKLTSNSLDLDQLIVLPDPKAQTPAPTGTAKSGEAGVPSGKDENLDKLLDPLRQNPTMAAMVMGLNASLKLIKFYDVRMTDTVARMSMKNLTASIDHFATKVFDGNITAKSTVAMKPATPTYSFSTGVSGLDLQKAVTSQLQLMKNTLVGQLNLKMEGGGASFNTEAAKKNLSAKGAFSVRNAKFASIDISKVAVEAINKGLDKIGDKIPGAQGKSVKSLEKETRYEVISADFSINNGTFTMPNFVAKAEKGTGLDLKGSTTVGLINQELKADWEITDTWNLTKARDVSVSLNNVNVPSILAEGNSPVTIPVSVGCKYTAPCPSYGRVPEHFAKIALNNTKKGATAAVKEEAKEKAKEAGKKILKGLFKE